MEYTFGLGIRLNYQRVSAACLTAAQAAIEEARKAKANGKATK